MKNASTSTQHGKLAEDMAYDYLRQQGLTFITRNYRYKGGEIDLIMRDSTYYVFVEVRLRRNADFGNGIESISRNKQRRIIKAAEHYLVTHHLMYRVACRFDAIGIDNHNQITWIKNAFQT